MALDQLLLVPLIQLLPSQLLRNLQPLEIQAMHMLMHADLLEQSPNRSLGGYQLLGHNLLMLPTR